MTDEREIAIDRNYKGSDYSFDCNHDPFNERIRIEHYSGNSRHVITHVLRLFTTGYSKCIVKVKDTDLSIFRSLGFSYEGTIRNYFSGVDMHVMTKFKENWRRNAHRWMEEEQILDGVLSKVASPLSEKPVMRRATEQDAEKLSVLYKSVFEVYPTPMDQPEYIRKVMKEGTIFYLVEEGNKITSAASAEVNRTFQNAEITDCATLPEFRKSGAMRHLILALESKLLDEGIYYAYSIARSLSFGMNAVFFQLGYEYGGRLINNVKIYDDWENMNLWSKALVTSAD
ncbi:putative beta-lysine N-acetyltransferase [Guptibacillus algicola]|uniref:putative beta-lysine N-acetyltransferase n=1 Tax=Guptibacillus algicola TaxID=225844 RepID=UPI001CD7D579|nr:putative beta-lysine N-acetyltransferase [Alkalihalobacillus algicola]MCA0988188.1 putative beta-lysine N-acetyltransferase [Alkalihalobacillus algicola]